MGAGQSDQGRECLVQGLQTEGDRPPEVDRMDAPASLGPGTGVSLGQRVL